MQFLEKYPFLISILREASAKIRPYFSDEKLFLQVVPVPEFIDYVHLVLSILTGRAPHDALNKLNQFDEDWLRPLAYEIKTQLITILEFHDDVRLVRVS